MKLVGRSIIILSTMVIAAVVTLYIRPTYEISKPHTKIKLESIIPKQFGEWKIDSNVIPVLPDPTRAAELSKLYSETVSRTYYNPDGMRIMLVVTYGDEQDRTLQIHKPEVCYATQGFQINQMTKINVDLGIGKVPAMHLVATQGQRVEPITYWIRIGDKLARGWFEQNIARVSYGLKGQIPDGVLVRVSNISGNEKDSYELQTAFLTSMLKGMHAEDRSLLVGTLSDQ